MFSSPSFQLSCPVLPGIQHVAFKPGSIDGIRQVVNIAVANPGFPIILQWTGGRAG